MSHSPPPVTPEQISALPPEFRALLQAVIDHYEKRIAALEADLKAVKSELTTVEAELKATKKTPRNSSLPPSSEHPHAKPPSQKKKRGGQPGHAKSERSLIPEVQCQDVILLKPNECRRCGEKLSGDDAERWRHRVWEVPEIQPFVTEYQRHRLTCSCCGESTCGQLPVR